MVHVLLLQSDCSYGEYRAMIKEVVQNSPYRTGVHMKGPCRMKREYLQQLCDGLKTNTHVTKLSVVNMDLDDDFAMDLAESLKHNSTLKVVDLKDNRFTKTGVLAILEAVTAVQSVKVLCLGVQPLEGFSVEEEVEVANRLEVNTVMTKIELRFSHNESITRIYEHFKKHARKRALNRREDSEPLRCTKSGVCIIDRHSVTCI